MVKDRENRSSPVGQYPTRTRSPALRSRSGSNRRSPMSRSPVKNYLSPHGARDSRSPVRRRSGSRNIVSRSRSGSIRRSNVSRSPAKNYSKKHSSPYGSRGRRSPDRRYRSSRSPVNRRGDSSSPKDRRRRRSTSRSPPRKGGRGRNIRDRENPSPSTCIGVFGLSKRTDERDLHKYFDRFGRIKSLNLIKDKYTSESMGFAFVYYEDVDSASKAKEEGSGVELDGRKIRVDFSITKKAHTPTPGMYMGKKSPFNVRRRGRFDSREESREYRGRGRDFERRKPHSRSPCSRSRSRSYRRY